MLAILIVLLFAFPALAQGPIGGLQAAPPFPDLYGPNQAPGGGCFTNLTGWTNGANVSFDNTVQHTGGCGSAKITPGSGGAVAMQARNIAVTAGQRWYIVTYWVKVDPTYNGPALAPFSVVPGDFTHNTTCCNLAPAGVSRTYETAAGTGGSDFVQLSYEVTIDPQHAGDADWFWNISPCTSSALCTGWTTGNVWVADVNISYDYNAIRTHLLYPNFHGYLWNDKTPPARYSPSVSPVLGMVDGVSELVDPVHTLASDTLVVKMATAAGCGSGVLATDSIAAPSATQYWQFKPSAYGTLTVGNTYFLCSKLTVTSGGATVEAYPDWGVVYENSAFRSALPSYFDENANTIIGGTPSFRFGTYHRASGTFGSGSITPLWTSSGTCTGGFTGAQCYANNIQGPGPSTLTPSVTTGISGLTYNSVPAPTAFASAVGESDNTMLWDFTAASTINPVSGSDQLSPLLDAMHTSGLVDIQIANNWIGSAVTGKTVAAAPTFNPSVTIGTGTITANFLFLEAASMTYTAAEGGQGGATRESEPGGTAAFTPISVNLAGATCAGTNCNTTFTMPACPTVTTPGFFLYYATNTVNTAPAQASFQRVYPTYAGQFTQTAQVPCGAAVTISALQNTNVPPPTTDNTIVGLPAWAVTLNITDAAALGDLGTTFAGASHPGGLAFHIQDEPPATSVYFAFLQSQALAAADNGAFNECVIDPASEAFLYFDAGCDVVDVDPYYIGQGTAIEPGEFVYVPIVGGSGQLSGSVYSTNNTLVTSTNTPVMALDSQVRETAAATYGSRPNWTTLQQFHGSNGPANAMPYAFLRQEMWHSIIGCKAYGAIDCGLMKWGNVSSLGLEQAYVSVGNGGYGDTNAYTDSVTAGAEIMGLQPALLAPTLDSPILGTGQIITSISPGTSTASDCGATSAYTNGTQFPAGAFNYHTATIGGVQYLFVTHLCPGGGPTGSGSNVNLTINLAAPGSATLATVYAESRTVAISGGAFTDSFAPAGSTSALDTHIFEITPGAGANPAPATGMFAKELGFAGAGNVHRGAVTGK